MIVSCGLTPSALGDGRRAVGDVQALDLVVTGVAVDDALGRVASGREAVPSGWKAISLRSRRLFCRLVRGRVVFRFFGQASRCSTSRAPHGGEEQLLQPREAGRGLGDVEPG